MISRLCCVLLGSGVLVVTLTAQTWGQDPYEQPRYNPYYRGDDPYHRGTGYRYGQNHHSLIRRVVSDLNQAASQAYLDSHELQHFEEVAVNLEDFQLRWSDGKFDTGKLDKAIHNLEHLAQADRVRGRDRERFARDLYDLRQFRNTRGRYYGSPGYYPNWR